VFTARPELTGDFGMVAGTHWLAASTGMGVLERSGNAFDAAVAAGFVLQVVEPHLNGPAGEAPILVYLAGSDTVEVIAGQGVAPAAATPRHFAALGLDLVPGTGQLAACVPGAFDAWMTLLARHGTLGPREVLEPAIGYAADGIPVLAHISESIERVAPVFQRDWPSSAAVYLPGGRPPAAGDRLRNPALAATFRRVLREAEAAGADREARIQAARDAFYRGFVAEAIDRGARRTVPDVSGRAHAGLLTADDLARWQTPVEAPTHLDYAGYRVFKTGPWGQGPVFLQQLALLAGFDLASCAPDDPRFVHTVVECAKLAFADRDAFYGDPDFTEVPLATLLSAEYADARRALVGAEASGELRPGSPPGSPHGRAPRIPAPAPGSESVYPRGIGEPTLGDLGTVRGDTCHLDVVDRFGNMVSATPSGGWLQSAPVIEELGFPLGTRAQMFWLTEGLPGTLAPGKRPRTTLSPSLAFRDGRPYLAFGTPGGDQQDQWSLLMFLRHVHFGMNLQEAIEAPAFHSTHFPSSFYPRESHPRELVLESRFPVATVRRLAAIGHEVVETGPWSLGRLSAVSRGPDGFLHAAANPRGMQGYAVGR
jgi:gamma-glutamyltranspeptidase/glutathione hydrolase